MNGLPRNSVSENCTKNCRIISIWLNPNEVSDTLHEYAHAHLHSSLCNEQKSISNEFCIKDGIRVVFSMFLC
jgi:hypothetical protein